MGWKNLKQHFNLEYIVQVDTEGRLLIGSAYLNDLLTIRPDGAISVHSLFADDKSGPLVDLANRLKEDPSLVRDLLASPDSFQTDIPVYTWEHGALVEKLCEEPGYPNITHDGRLMHDNTYFLRPEDACAKAHSSSVFYVEHWERQVERLQRELDGAFERLEKARAELKTVTELRETLTARPRS